MNSILTGAINRIWASNSRDVQMVGYSGAIVRYVNGNWEKVESGTMLPVQDMWGGTNGSSTEIVAVASNLDVLPTGKALFRIQGSTASPVSTVGLHDFLRGIWGIPARRWYVVGAGIYRSRGPLSDPRWEGSVGGITGYESWAVRGTGLADVFVVGASGDIVHFNGSTWKSYQLQTALSNGVFTAVAVRGRAVIAVGIGSARGAVAIGRRQ
jgi:hypothetical protein